DYLFFLTASAISHLYTLSLHDALPILPLLRQSKLKPRPAKILKWEGIIVDPLGVLLAEFAFEIISFFTSGSNNVDTLLLFFFGRSEEHTSELQSRFDLVCRLLLEKQKQ